MKEIITKANGKPCSTKSFKHDGVTITVFFHGEFIFIIFNSEVDVYNSDDLRLGIDSIIEDYCIENNHETIHIIESIAHSTHTEEVIGEVF